MITNQLTLSLIFLIAIIPLAIVLSKRPPPRGEPFPEPGRRQNPWSRFRNQPSADDEDNAVPKRPVFANAPRESCLWIRGRVKCENENGDHNGRTALAYFVDSSKGRIDETYTSKNGLFSLFGCSPDSFASSDVQLELVHDCKTANNGSTSIKFLMPYSNQKEVNITDIIDLKSYYTDEKRAGANDFRVPCDPF